MSITTQGRGDEAICRMLDGFVAPEVYKKATMPSLWNKILPSKCYRTNFSWSTTSVDIPFKESLGAFAPMNDKESKDTPVIGFSTGTDRIDLYDNEANIEFTREEIDRYNNWTTNAGLSTPDFVSEKIDSAIEVYNLTQDKYFFHGDGNRTKGLLNLATEIKDLDPSLTKSSLRFIPGVIAKVREHTKGIIRLGTLVISPKYSTVLGDFYESSDKSTRTKLSSEIIDTNPDGTPLYIKIMVVDRLSETITAEKPYGDAFFLARDPSLFRVYYKPLMNYEFRAHGARSFISAAKFKYSDPYVYAKYAVTKIAIPKNIDQNIVSVKA